MGEAATAANKRIPFAFLADVKTRALAHYGLQTLQQSIAFSINAEMAPLLASRMKYFNSPSADKLTSMQASIDGVRDNMVANVERILERGERVELLVDKSENLSQQAFRFERSSNTLRATMRRQRMRMYAAAAGIFLVLIVVVSAMACGGLGYSKCRARS